LKGAGRPCVMTVDSNATTGIPSRNARLTSGPNVTFDSILFVGMVRF